MILKQLVRQTQYAVEKAGDEEALYLAGLQYTSQHTREACYSYETQHEALSAKKMLAGAQKGLHEL
jgi:hypothetical protein